MKNKIECQFVPEEPKRTLTYEQILLDKKHKQQE